jgi:hypothetical protein
MSEKLYASIGQSLLAIGLYTVAFESMVLAFRARMYAYLQLSEPASVQKFLKSCNTADNTFKFCAPMLIKFGVIDESDVSSLTEMRRRRNTFAHEGYNKMMALTVRDVESDVKLMHRITGKVERWRHQDQNLSTEEKPVSTRIDFSVSPAIFGLYLQIATEIAYYKLPVEPMDDTR